MCSRSSSFVFNIAMEKRHKLLAVLVHLVAVMLVVMVIFNALGGAGYQGLFNQNTGQVSANYTVYITPAGFAFSIWSVIYIFLGVVAIYCVSTVYRRSGPNSRVYIQPVILNWLFYIALALNYCLNTAWIFLWDKKLMVLASIFLFLVVFTGWLSFAVASIRGKQASEKGKGGVCVNAIFKEIRLQRILIHNGIALYTTWTTIASLLNANIAFQYFGNYEAETTSLVCLAVLLTIMIGWFILENIWLDLYVRYTLVQYPVIIFATFAILSKQGDESRPDGPVPENVRILTWLVLGVATVQFCARFVITIYRYRTRPLFQIEPLPVATEEE